MDELKRLSALELRVGCLEDVTVTLSSDNADILDCMTIIIRHLTALRKSINESRKDFVAALEQQKGENHES